ncbi:MAG TPA: hypothetical protein VIC55_09870 [Gemmatimonadaceae bacterium]|jgi:hypothetical protein
MNTTRALALAGLCVGLAACGGDSTAPKSAQVDGTWVASFTSIVGDVDGVHVACSSIAPTQLSISQSGSAFSGTYDGGTLSCTTEGNSASLDFGSGSIVNGTIAGQNVAFDLDSPQEHLTGVVSGTSAAGRIAIADTANGVALSGTWSASRVGASSNRVARALWRGLNLTRAVRAFAHQRTAIYRASH